MSFNVHVLKGSNPQTQYDKITDKDPNTLYILQSGKGYLGDNILFDIASGSSSGSVNFSTEEHICGRWHDGRLLYERTIVKDNFSLKAKTEGSPVFLDIPVSDISLLDTSTFYIDAAIVYGVYGTNSGMFKSAYQGFLNCFIRYPNNILRILWYSSTWEAKSAVIKIRYCKK